MNLDEQGKPEENGWGKDTCEDVGHASGIDRQTEIIIRKEYRRRHPMLFRNELVGNAAD